MSSTPTAGASGAREDRRRSLGRYVKRMSSVFRRDKPAKASSSTTPATPSATPAPVVAPPTAIPEEQQATPTYGVPLREAHQVADSASAAVTVSTPAPSTDRTASTSQPTRRKLQEERARALFARYGLTLESHEWIVTPTHGVPAQRIEKPIRMRVHHKCHRCSTTYGIEKACVTCGHKRCKQCPRYPDKKTSAARMTRGAVDLGEAPMKKRVLTITARTVGSGTGELALGPAKQRVRRTCHKCEAQFVPPTATSCSQCRHVRCTRCPREPSKRDKWPHGYPGDVDASDAEQELGASTQTRRMVRRPKTRVSWECDECHDLFVESSPQCPGCGHQRCGKCVRKVYVILLQTLITFTDSFSVSTRQRSKDTAPKSWRLWKPNCALYMWMTRRPPSQGPSAYLRIEMPFMLSSGLCRTHAERKLSFAIDISFTPMMHNDDAFLAFLHDLRLASRAFDRAIRASEACIFLFVREMLRLLDRS